MKRSLFFGVVAGMLVLGAGLPSLQAQQRTITVIGDGDAEADPETVSLNVTITTQDASALGVFVKNDDALGRMRKAIEGAGVPKSNIVQGNYMINPTYDFSQPNAGPKLTGFHLITPMEIRLTDIKQLARVMDLAAQNGASNISIGTFGLKKKDALRDRATKEALKDAKERAEELAEQAGADLGPVVSISDIELSAGGGGGEEREREGAQTQHSLSEHVELKVTYLLK